MVRNRFAYLGVDGGVGWQTLLSEHEEPFTTVFVRNVKMIRLYPLEQRDSLLEYVVSFEVICRDWSWWYHSGYLRGKRAV